LLAATPVNPERKTVRAWRDGNRDRICGADFSDYDPVNFDLTSSQSISVAGRPSNGNLCLITHGRNDPRTLAIMPRRPGRRQFSLTRRTLRKPSDYNPPSQRFRRTNPVVLDVTHLKLEGGETHSNQCARFNPDGSGLTGSLLALRGAKSGLVSSPR
jgi:hypothetical protein